MVVSLVTFAILVVIFVVVLIARGQMKKKQRDEVQQPNDD